MKLERNAALYIEQSFVSLAQREAGDRKTPWDANVWNNGNSERLGTAILEAANALELRAKKVKFTQAELANGMPGARLEVAISHLKAMGSELKSSNLDEPKDYHWGIVGSLVGAIGSLLDHMGA